MQISQVKLANIKPTHKIARISDVVSETREVEAYAVSRHRNVAGDLTKLQYGLI
jgi:hypothetical protein